MYLILTCITYFLDKFEELNTHGPLYVILYVPVRCYLQLWISALTVFVYMRLYTHLEENPSRPHLDPKKCDQNDTAKQIRNKFSFMIRVKEVYTESSYIYFIADVYNIQCNSRSPADCSNMIRLVAWR